MAMRIIRGVIAVVVGIVFGMMFMMGLHLATTLIYPLPEGVSFTSQEPENMERMKEWFASLPAGAFLLASLCHGLGCMSGAVVAMCIAGRRSLVPAIAVGVVFTLAGVMNLSSIPHPSWFPFVDVPIYLVFAILAGILLQRSTNKEQTVDSPSELAS